MNNRFAKNRTFDLPDGAFSDSTETVVENVLKAMVKHDLPKETLHLFTSRPNAEKLRNFLNKCLKPECFDKVQIMADSSLVKQEASIKWLGAESEQ